MRLRVINNTLMSGLLFSCWLFCLLMSAALPAAADDITVDRDGGSAQYTEQQVADNSNPWALPTRPSKKPEYQQQPYTYDQQSQQDPAYQYDQQRQPSHRWQPQSDRFVTPDFLDSLKQQQQYYQIMPENQRYNQPESRYPGHGSYGSPVYGAGTVNPLYDSPALSPWSNDADVIYRGESFPLVPGEALGGLPPMFVPGLGVSNYKKHDTDGSRESEEYKVFNPFTFLPDGGLP
jgi:hypothetical protein